MDSRVAIDPRVMAYKRMLDWAAFADCVKRRRFTRATGCRVSGWTKVAYRLAS